jgi:hypothetical protein
VWLKRSIRLLAMVARADDPNTRRKSLHFSENPPNRGAYAQQGLTLRWLLAFTVFTYAGSLTLGTYTVDHQLLRELPARYLISHRVD